MTLPTVRKGARIRAEWLKATLNTALAGMQPKLGAVSVVVEGVVTHIYGYGNDPANPTRVEVWVQPDSGPEVKVAAEHVVAILSDPT